MASATSGASDAVKRIVRSFEARKEEFEHQLTTLRSLLEGSRELRELAHSFKYRIKDPSHLEDKLCRKQLELGDKFDYTEENLCQKVNDLVGARVLHLHMGQFPSIHSILNQLVKREEWVFVEKPNARTWDPEYKQKFEEQGLNVRDQKFYTSVHMVVAPNSKLRFTFEIQVRTLVEEVWGEVSHTVNYPHETTSTACKEQLAVLARLVSANTRLVDAIFASLAEHKRNSGSVIVPGIPTVSKHPKGSLREAFHAAKRERESRESERIQAALKKSVKPKSS